MKPFRLRLLALLATISLLAGTASAQVTIPNTLVAGTTIRASDLNTNFTTLGNHALDRISGGNITGNITMDPGITIDGLDLSVALCATCAATFKDLTLSSPATGITVAGVNIVNLNGKIPAISSTYFASLSGANLTGIAAATALSGIVPVANGGTGVATLTANNVLLGNGTSAVTSVAPGTSGNVLTSNGTTWSSTAPNTTAGGSNTQLQYNNSTAFGGTSGLTWDSTNNQLTSTNQFRAVVWNAATQSISNNTATALTFDSEITDVGNMHSVASNTSRITIPTGGTGLYWIYGATTWAANATGSRTLSIKVNNTTTLSEGYFSAPSGSAVTGGNTALLYSLTAGDYIELLAYQDSGGSLNAGAAGQTTASKFMAVKLW